MIFFLCSRVREWLSAFRLAAPISYMLTVAMAFIRGSILAALMTKLPLPQIPRTPIRSRSTNGLVPRKSTAALKASALNIRQNRVAWLPLALSPERLINSQGDESLISQFLSIQIRTLFLHCTHWVPDYDRGIFRAPIQVFGDEKIPRNRHVVLILKCNLLRSYLIALVEVTRAIGHICSDGDGQCAGSKC